MNNKQMVWLGVAVLGALAIWYFFIKEDKKEETKVEVKAETKTP